MAVPTKIPVETALRTLNNYVGGHWAPAEHDEALPVRNPASGQALARVPLSKRSAVDAAVAAAREAQVAWGATSPIVRARALFKLRDALDMQREQLAAIVTRDMGKTLDDARGEVGRGIESCEMACAMPELMKGENLEGVARGVDVELIRQPVGVVAAITPFNFPAMIPLWFLPFAIAAGNAFILKPSERDPLASERIVELVAGIKEIPKGIVSLVHGAHEVVNALLMHPGIDAISFVGQASTARYVAEKAHTYGKRVQALGGAKNSMVVMPDAEPGLAMTGVLGSAFGAAGQRCLAGSVAVLVGTREEQDAARDRIVESASALAVGDGMDPDIDVCPMVSPEARERVEKEIAKAETEGARVVLDGRREGGVGGAELGPTVIDGAGRESRVAREELFGPVLTLVRVESLDQAIDWVNGSRYGNASVIFTSSGHAAREYRSRVQAGMVGVNIGVAAPVAWFPFSGWKDSFEGDLHANGRDAVEFYTRKKVVTSRWS